MLFKAVILWTDALIYLLVSLAIVFTFWARKREHIMAPLRQVVQKRLAIVSILILSSFAIIGLLDSVHYQPVLEGNGANGEVHYAAQSKSLLDKLISPLGQNYEKTYSKPFSLHLYQKESIQQADGTRVRSYPRLKFAGTELKDHSERAGDITIRILQAASGALVITLLLWLAIAALRAKGKLSTAVPWRTFFISSFCLFATVLICMNLSQEYHIFGTDKVGQDVFYQTIKSIRTGLVIGTLTTLVMLPFAILLGIAAGYFGGIIDDVIQYTYTTLSSIPGVLLIAATILSLQVYISKHEEIFNSLASRADARLLALCVILGVTSWTGLCRMLRGETLKLREIDYIQAAHALGVSHLRIILRHILPNLMHIVLISIVLDFSGLVLAEAVLSYVGVGVDPSAISWGNMINSARLELAREPVVWWPLLASFTFMFTLVLFANLFADTIRDAFDPRLRNI